ncbi:MAG: LuxR C-terminal-related transcriptional regulator [Hydrogenophaga sp.]|jgi:DNA-binding CsgD family transcriptional regulator|nr:LuxR C-terminal-related transcriptional regulator [Hydrogenophaga sp.]
MWHASENLSRNAYNPAAAFAPPGLEQTLLLRVMDEIDYGVLVIDGQGRLRHTNHLARHEMASGRLIVSHGNVLLGTTTEFTGQIQAAMEQALRGQRKLLLLNKDDKELSMAFIPLSHPLESDAPCVLVLLSRQSACENLAVRMYARAQHLSPSEESVMMGLCRGLSIPDIAQDHGVAQSTVRSQIKALREKTGCSSIRKLLQRVNSLPPVVPALRIVSPVSHNAMAFAQP